MKTKAYLLPILLAFIACSKGDDSIPEVKEPFVSIPMDLTNLQTGQKFRYVLLTGDNYRSVDGENYAYTGDTLELEVLQSEPGRYLVSERITQMSNMKTDTSIYYWRGENTVYANYWVIRNDSLIIETDKDYFYNSHLLPMYEPNLSLNDFVTQEVQINGWKTSANYIEYNAGLFTLGFNLFGETYDRLNVYINNEHMQYDANGFTTVYSIEHGIIRTSEYTWWTQEGYGWDKL